MADDPAREVFARHRAIRSMGLDFERLFAENYDQVVCYLLRRVNRAIAEDIASETFIEAYDHRASFKREKGTPRAWLFGIVMHLLSHHRRDEARQRRAYARVATCEDRSVPDFAGETSDRVDASALRAPVGAALATLNRGEYDVLTLYYWVDLSYDEIAQALGIRPGTVASRMSKARAHVRCALADLEKSPYG